MIKEPTIELQKSNSPENLMEQACRRPWEIAIAPFRVAPHVYYVSGNIWVGCYLIETGDGLILIDTAMHETLYLLLESIRILGFNPKDIKMILLSHAHCDHCGGLRAMAEYTGAKVYMGKEDLLFLHDRPELIYAGNYTCGTFEPDEFYDDNKPITLGNITIRTLHTPGHTPGTTSFFFSVKDEEGKEYKCGMHGGIGANTLTDEYFASSKLPVSLREDYINCLLKLKDMDIDITLGSHPQQVDMISKVPEITDSDNPFYDKSVWPLLMERRIAGAKALMK